MFSRLPVLLKNHKGADMAEYAMVAAGVILLAAAAFFALGGNISSVVSRVSSMVGGG